MQIKHAPFPLTIQPRCDRITQQLNMRAWPRCSALPVAEEAEHKRVLRSIKSRISVRCEDFIGHRNRNAWGADRKRGKFMCFQVHPLALNIAQLDIHSSRILFPKQKRVTSNLDLYLQVNGQILIF